MKRLISICVAVVMTVSLLSASVYAADTGFSVSGATAFTVRGNEDIMNEATMKLQASVEAMEELLNQAAKPEKAPTDAEEVAAIVLIFPEGPSQAYSILLDDNGMYAKLGGKVLQIDETALNKCLNAFGNDLYKYRKLPTLALVSNDSEGAPLYVGSYTYAYEKLDGKYYRPFFVQNDLENVLDSSKAWPELSFSLKPTAVVVSVVDTRLSSSTAAFSGSWRDAEQYVKANPGLYGLKIEAAYSGDHYRGTVIYSCSMEDMSVLESKQVSTRFLIEGSSTYPGEVMVLRARKDKNSDKIEFSSDKGITFTPTFFDTGDNWYMALMPVSYFTSVGSHTISLKCGENSVKWEITVKDKKFQIQNLVVDETTSAETINSQKANNEYETVIAPLRSVADSKQYWEGFVWPVTGPVTTEFGMIRYTNGQPTSSRHGAIDFAVPKGTPVKATANGRVLYAGFLQLTGNTVLIEHGFGLKSWYYHMDSTSVKTGDMIKMSQEIGKVGSTGFSTGAHLHFGMSVNNVFVNPTTIIETDLLKSNN